MHTSDGLWSKTLDVLPIAAFVAGVDGAIEHVSAGWTALTGYDASETLGFGYLRAIDVADIDRIGTMWSARAASEVPVSGEFRLHCTDGSRRWIRLDLQPIAGGAGGLVHGWFGSITDVDGYKRALEAVHESESTYREVYGPQDLVFVEEVGRRAAAAIAVLLAKFR